MSRGKAAGVGPMKTTGVLERKCVCKWWPGLMLCSGLIQASGIDFTGSKNGSR